MAKTVSELYVEFVVFGSVVMPGKAGEKDELWVTEIAPFEPVVNPGNMEKKRGRRIREKQK